MSTATVLRLHGPGDLRLTDEPVAPTGEGMSLVRVTAVGLCGSDLHWYTEGGIGDARLRTPLVLGHEFAGVVDGGRRHGQRVAVDPAIPCLRCVTCAAGKENLCPEVRFAGHGGVDGALRQYVAWPAHLVHPLPDSVSDVDGAMLEPLGVALHAFDLGHVPLGGTVAVIGCGPIGLLLVQLARRRGAKGLIAVDPLAHRRAAATRFGADAALDPAAIDEPTWMDLTRGGADVTFEVAGTSNAVDQAMAAAQPGGRVVLVGIPDDDRTTFRAAPARRKGLTVLLSRRMNHAYPRAIDLVDRRNVDVTSLVTERFPLAEATRAFQVASDRRGLKVVIEPTPA